MESFPHRESVLLGYSPQRFVNHSSSSPKSPNSNSDFDFNDVFGGPPRRSSIQEVRFSLADTRDPNAMRSDDDTVSSGHRWSGLDEKPVFGDDGVNRRRCTSDNFFNDIFGGNNSLSSSPRKHDRDPFSYSSRVLSPVRPLPPRAEPLGSSLPAQFSLPAKLIKGPELPTFGSSARNHHRNKDGAPNGTSHYSNSPLSRSSSQANLVQEELGNDVYRQSSLSKELSVGSEDLIIPDETDKDNNLKRDLKNSEVTANGGQFHFSIYRWASKGAPLAAPLRSGSSKFREKYAFEKSASSTARMASESLTRELQAATSQEYSFSSLNRSVSLKSKTFENEVDEPPQLVENAVHPGIRLAGNPVEESEPHSYPDSDFSDKPKEEITSAAKDVSKTELKTLYSLFFDNDYKQDVDDTSRKNGVKENKTNSTRKASTVYGVNGNGTKQEGKKTTLKPEEVDKAILQDSPTRDNLRKNKLRGRVKDFVKFFNQEDSEKPKSEADSRTRHSRTKEKGQLRSTDEAGVDTIGINEANRLSNGIKNDKPDTSFMVDDYLKESTRQHPQTRTSTCKSSDIASGLKDSSTSARATVPDGSNAAFEDLKQSFQGNFVIKELVLDVDKQPQTSGNHEEIQAIDAKIRKWSNGKEGNIRSLLSTLQYVLWPESGWKPVPLVDIIEASAVKRSYNKALLYLHPDKLLQKGATSHQKYIAEKVFDILQEAWTHFNSLGSI